MAGVQSEAADPLQSNPIFQDINGSIAQILRQITCKSKADIIDELVRHIDGVELQECRDYTFKAAVGVYDEQLEAVGITGGRARLELKQRRGDSLDEKCATDIVDLIVYVCGLSKHFPRDVLSSRSTYIDIAPAVQTENGDSVTSQVVSDNVVANLMKRCDEYDRRLKNAWEYIMNIEKVTTDEISALKNTLSKCKCCAKGLTGNGVSTSQAGSGATLLSPTDRTPASTNPHTGATKPPAAADRNVPGRPAPNDLTTSGHHAQKDALTGGNGTVENRVIIDADDSDYEIPCAQPQSDKQNVSSSTSNANINVSTLQSTQTATSSTSSTQTSTVATPTLQSTPRVPDTVSDNNPGSSDVNGSGSRTYLDVASVPGDWNLVPTGRRRKATNHQQHDMQQNRTQQQNPPVDRSGAMAVNSAQQNASNRPISTSLTGLKTEQSADMYVENIERRPHDQLKDIAERVRRYCREKGIRVMQARVITNRRCVDVVGCRITIPVRQIDDVLGNRMWPDEVICRRWKNQQGLRAGRRREYDDGRRRQYREDEGREQYDAQYAGDRNGDYWDYRRDDDARGDYRGHSDRYNHWQSDEYDHGQRGYWSGIF